MLDGCELYTTCEPCPMCFGAIYWARIKAVYYGSTRHDAADIGFDDGKIYHEINLEGNQRDIRFVQVESDTALTVFREWEANEAKIMY